MKRTLLIDGDEYAYVACAAVEYEAWWDDQNVYLASNVEQAWDSLRSKLQSVTDTIGDVGALVFAFGSSPTFRKALYEPYKSKRSKRPPLCLSKVIERIFETYETVRYPGVEGDDVLGILATNGSFENPVIVSQDKDMLTLPTTLWREGALLVNSVGDADYHWLKQTLTGDSADGYPGCPGVGPVGAEKLLDLFTTPSGFQTDEAWKAVVQTYEAKGLTQEDALVQARLARILRCSDWDAEKQEVKLWEPR